MNELITWINKSIRNITGMFLYEKYFKNLQPEKLDDTDVFYLENLDAGIDVVFNDSLIVTSIHLFSGSFMEAKVFDGILPFDLSFKFSKEKVNIILGEPNVSGGGFNDDILSYIELWDKYYFESYSLHFKYSRDKSEIKLITLGSLDFEN